ncbi:RIKEN cDNA 0610008F07, isoform CRA_a, partial [Mus musculus]
ESWAAGTCQAILYLPWGSRPRDPRSYLRGPLLPEAGTRYLLVPTTETRCADTCFHVEHVCPFGGQKSTSVLFTQQILNNILWHRGLSLARK